MSTTSPVAAHYAHGGLIEAITAGLAAIGKTPETVAVDDLAPVDEFHIGGRQATEDFIARLGLAPEHRVLEIGCGLGGTARFVAHRHGCRVAGIDLTPEFIDAARILSDWVGLAERAFFHLGDALAMPFEAASFDAAVMQHVGMNVRDKDRLFAEAARVLKPGGPFGVYDVMATGEAPLAFPVPWAAGPETSALAAPADYRAALEAAGFEIAAERDRRDFALAFFEALRARMDQAGGPPPLGVHLVMGEDAPAKVANMVANIRAGGIAPVEIIARRSPI